MQLEEIRALVADDLQRVDQTIVQRLASDIVLVNQVSQYIIGGGGKRLRPLSVVLAARACGHQGQKHVPAAAIIEFIHTATLLHDDVVDSSEMRRGRDTANHVFGNEASVLVGDYLYSRAFQMMVELGDLRIQEVMANATNTIAEGEVLQLMNAHDPETTEQRYLEVIYRKTAKLFEAGAQMAAILSGSPREIEQAMIDYGRHLGTAFQLVDDALDYRATAEELGKNLGDDLAEGKPTLPVIYALAHAPAAEAARLRDAIETGGIDDLDQITRLIETSGGLEYTARMARREKELAVEALGSLPASKYRDALVSLADFAVARTY
ncbi:MAG: octaprenyl diphosphate synthase [Gammaproteobacteria bacterium]|nr:octaprenyl diphosphate synthase [Gammaproteobacteria bacterium]MDH5273320.1 octaprenyl diphosphate synthase [Gammaproteobacteria bacterium]